MDRSECLIESFKCLERKDQAKVAKFIIEENRKAFQLSKYPILVTVGDLESWLEQPELPPNKERIIDFISHRLNNRFLVPLEKIDQSFKSGFLTMATVCLLIETLQQFYTGVDETPGRHEEAFKSFFGNELNSSRFPNCEDHYRAFYKDIRCGILHQAETKRGYRLLQDGLLFDADKKTINIAAFEVEMRKCLEVYVMALRTSESTDPLWKNAVKKLRCISRNCQAT